MSTERLAGVAKSKLFSRSLSSTKASIELRDGQVFEETSMRELPLFPCSGRKAHIGCSSSRALRSLSPVSESLSLEAIGAPCAIQRRINSTSLGRIVLTLTSTSRRRGGISSAKIRFMIKLSPGLPTTKAGPDFPPCSIDARVRRSKSASRAL